MKLSNEAYEAVKADALTCYPYESCGVIVDGKYVRVENVAADKTKEFEMPQDTWMQHKIEAVVHSHNMEVNLEPSAADMRGQMATNIPWGIIQTDGKDATDILFWGDFVLDEPLLGRQFKHGVRDCYAAIRAWHWQTKGIKLKDVPRDNGWWKKDADLYMQNFGEVGGKIVSESDVQPGDVALIHFRSEVPNHGGILLENGLLYHHLENRLSSREPIGRWKPMIAKWLRYEG